MASIFRIDSLGPWAPADPQSEKRWGITAWLPDLTFSSVTWIVSPASGVTLLNEQINASPVTIGGRTFAAGLVASVIVKGLVAGTTYTLTARATFSDGQKDDMSFRLIAAEQ